MRKPDWQKFWSGAMSISIGIFILTGLVPLCSPLFVLPAALLGLAVVVFGAGELSNAF